MKLTQQERQMRKFIDYTIITLTLVNSFLFAVDVPKYDYLSLIYVICAYLAYKLYKRIVNASWCVLAQQGMIGITLLIFICLSVYLLAVLKLKNIFGFVILLGIIGMAIAVNVKHK